MPWRFDPDPFKNVFRVISCGPKAPNTKYIYKVILRRVPCGRVSVFLGCVHLSGKVCEKKKNKCRKKENEQEIAVGGNMPSVRLAGFYFFGAGLKAQAQAVEWDVQPGSEHGRVGFLWRQQQQLDGETAADTQMSQEMRQKPVILTGCEQKWNFKRNLWICEEWFLCATLAIMTCGSW